MISYLPKMRPNFKCSCVTQILQLIQEVIIRHNPEQVHPSVSLQLLCLILHLTFTPPPPSRSCLTLHKDYIKTVYVNNSPQVSFIFLSEREQD
jgi:hypothetical protein